MTGVQTCALPISPWVRLQKKGSGYARKLRYATRQAKDGAADGLVATVDSDSLGRSRRLQELKNGRDQDRQTAPPFPTAVGEAIPHLEAWLIDDPVATREALQLPAQTPVPTVRQTKNPKAALDELVAQCGRFENVIEALVQIAGRVEPARCVHAAETGFKSFADDVRQELKPLFGEPRRAP